ncbi:elongation factor P 5-aminopentanone reductase [Clostridium mediterraneense]|uniref:elongation factor P 5-aminopentanone reductase n=1 Tax=Clostridium mediterraneense TaxID=1805472 RepID=UPI00082DEFC6|nr:SDR family oxidoreductase [Clostridium mediterraneense]
MDFKGKVAVITGGTRGIGKAIALEMVRNGANVVLNYTNNDFEAEKTLNEIKEKGGYALLVKASVGELKGCETIINTAIESFGKIDFLINNAAISEVGLFMDVTDEGLNNILDINLKGVLNCSKIAMTHLIESRGAIVNISSIWGNVGASCEVLYSTTKGAINLFTKSLAKEMAMSGIRVNAVAPGVINTEMNSWMDQSEREALEEEIPLNRFGNTEEIASVVSFLCSEKASYVTGQIITVDGGML